jgi:hypothetical protein
MKLHIGLSLLKDFIDFSNISNFHRRIWYASIPYQDFAMTTFLY